jgi:DNA-binding transcriptional regulator YdaS (Cro superfamily)
MPPHMTLSEFLTFERGRVGALANQLGVSGSMVTQWANGKAVSAERCPQIERATAGAVRRWDLRPRDWHLIWPELLNAPGAPHPVEKASNAA